MRTAALILAALLAWPALARAVCLEPNEYAGFAAVYHDDTADQTTPTSPKLTLLATDRSSGAQTYIQLTPTAMDDSDATTVDTGVYEYAWQVPGSPVFGTYLPLFRGQVPTTKDVGKVTPAVVEVRAVGGCDPADVSALALETTAGAAKTAAEAAQTVLESLCQASGQHFTISGTPTSTVFETDYSAPDDFGLGNVPAYVWVHYADGYAEGARLADFGNTNGTITLSAALTHGAPASGDEGCIQIGVNP